MNVIELRDKRKALEDLTFDIVVRSIRFNDAPGICKERSIDKWYPYPKEGEEKEPIDVFCDFVDYVQRTIKSYTDDDEYDECRDGEYISETMDLLDDKYQWIARGTLAFHEDGAWKKE